jgi:hypothetical protein
VLYQVLTTHFDTFLGQTFGNRLNFHPHLHMLVTEGGGTNDGSFQPIPIFNDKALTRIFAHEVLALLVSKELISPETQEKILSWRHTGFNVHSKMRTTTSHVRFVVMWHHLEPVVIGYQREEC